MQSTHFKKSGFFFITSLKKSISFKTLIVSSEFFVNENILGISIKYFLALFLLFIFHFLLSKYSKKLLIFILSP
jgi:hypothetical protein